MPVNGLFIHGGACLDAARLGDRPLTSTYRSLTGIEQGIQNRCIRAGSACRDLTSLSQLILPDGATFRSEVQEQRKYRENGITMQTQTFTNDEWGGYELGTNCESPGLSESAVTPTFH